MAMKRRSAGQIGEEEQSLEEADELGKQGVGDGKITV